MAFLGPGIVRPRTGSRRRGLFAVVLALLVSGSGVALAIHSAEPVRPGGTGASATGATGHASKHSEASRSLNAVTTPAAVPVSTAGSVVRTDFLNYNSTLPGNFPSTVAGWQVGTPAYVPSTQILWLPELPVSVGGIPAPPMAPAVRYNTSSDQFSGFVPWLTNTSALVFDPNNGLLYSADSMNSTVGVLNAITGLWVHSAIPVGTDPVALALNPEGNLLYVANEGSNNITVINCATNSVGLSGISTGGGTSPHALAFDMIDHTLFVADGGDNYVRTIDTTTNLSGASVPFLGVPAGLAYSPASRSVAVTIPSEKTMPILNASLLATAALPVVGPDAGPVLVNANATDFVVSNGSRDLAIVNSTSGVLDDSHLPAGANVTILSRNGAQNQVFAWSPLNRSISTVNLTTEMTSARSSTLGTEPSSVAYVPTLNRVFISDVFGGSLIVLNATTGLTAAPPISLSSGVLSAVADSSEELLYVGAWGEVATVNPQTDSVVTQDSGLTNGNTPLLVDAQDGLLWVANGAKGLVALHLVTLAPDFIVGIPTGFVSQSTMTLDPTAHELFVVNTTSHDVEVVNSTNGAILDPSIAAGANLTSIVYDPADNAVYALGANVSIISPSTFQVVGSPILIAPHALATGIAYDATREAIYAATATGVPTLSGTLSVIDGSSAAASQGSFVSISVGQLPGTALPIQFLGSSPPAFGEVWVPNEQSGTVSVIASPPAITYLTASPAAVDLNQTSQILLGYDGGTGPVEISYTGLPTGCASEDLTTLNCTSNEIGTFSITATVEDARGATASATTTLTVVAALTLRASTTPGPNPVLDVGTLLTGDATALGGSPPYVYSWTFGDGSSAATPDCTHRYASPGSFLVNVSVSDTHGAIVSRSFIVTVEPLPTSQVAVSPSNTTDVGLALQLSSTVTGGTGPGAAEWSFGDGTSAAGFLVTHAWNRSGSYTVHFSYEDSWGNYANQTLLVRINPALTATFSSGRSGAGSTLTVGSPSPFTALVSGGTPPYTVVWSFGDGSFGRGLTVDHAYASAGSYAVNVTLSDAAGATVNASLPVTVTTVAATPSSSGGFGLGIFFGVVAGGGLAAVVLYVAGSRRRQRRPPQVAWVPPAPQTPSGWKED